MSRHDERDSNGDRDSDDSMRASDQKTDKSQSVLPFFIVLSSSLFDHRSSVVGLGR